MVNNIAPLSVHTGKKNKVLVAIGAVLFGHAAVLFALSQMQVSELKKIEPPKPIQVRLIQPPQPKVEPSKPVEPPKPKQVEIKDTPPPPPKKVEKVEQVKKEVAKPKVAEPPKPTKIETQAPPPVTPTVTEVVQKPVVIEKPVVVETPKADPTPPQPTKPAVDNTPRNLGGSSIAWIKPPNPEPQLKNLEARDLKAITNETVVIRVDVDATGKVKATLIKSSGSKNIDKIFLRAVERAKAKPYMENGVPVPSFAEQPFFINKPSKG